LKRECWSKVTPNYELLEFLGKGTYGVVIKARDRKTKENVAIKFIHNINGNYDTVKVLRELQALRLLKSN
jgi:cell division cycle 2-like protein